jgi:hypothetical protein
MRGSGRLSALPSLPRSPATSWAGDFRSRYASPAGPRSAAVLAVALAAPTLLPTAELVGAGESYKYDPFGASIRRVSLEGGRWSAAYSWSLPFVTSQILGFSSLVPPRSASSWEALMPR